MRRSTKFLIKATLNTTWWLAFSSFWVHYSLNSTMPWLAGLHVMCMLTHLWLYFFSEYSAIVIWRGMRLNEDLDKRYGVLA